MSITHHLLIAALFTCLQAALHCLAQPAYVLDPDFTPAIRPTVHPTAVQAAAVQPDGKVLVNGSVRLNPDGTMDQTFRPEIEDLNARHLVVQADGRILVGSWNEFGPFSLVRLNSDGSRDAAWNPWITATKPGIGGPPSSVTSLPDGAVLLVDWWGSLFKLNAAGQPDSLFVPTISGTLLSVQIDGRLLVADPVHEPDREGSAGKLVRLNGDGSLDAQFTPPADITNVLSAVVQIDGKIVIAGNFDRLGGQPRKGLARLLPNGVLDEGFNPSVAALSTVGDGNDYWSVNLALDPRGRIVLLIVSPLNVGAYLAFIESTGIVEREVPVRGLGLDQTQRHPILGLLPDDSLIVQDRQAMPCCKGQTFPHFAHVGTDGTVDPTFFAAAVGAVPNFDAIAPQEEGRILVRGAFLASGRLVTPFGRFNSGGAFDETYARPSLGGYGTEGVFAFLPDGKILTPRSNLDGSESVIRLGVDGSFDSSFAETPFWPPGYECECAETIRLLPQGAHGIVADTFLYSGNGYSRGLRRIKPNGRWDESFQVQLGRAWITALAVDQSDRILVVTRDDVNLLKSFTRLNPDGTPDGSFTSRLAPSLVGQHSVEGVFPLRDGKIVVLNRELRDMDSTTSWLTRLLPDGSIDMTFPQNRRPGLLHVLATTDDDTSFVWSDTPDGSHRLIRIAADGAENTLLHGPTGIGHQRITGSVRAMLVEPDGSLVIAGGFTAIGNAERPGLARLKPAPLWRDSAFDVIGRFTGTIGCLTGWRYRVEASADLKHWDIVATGTSTGESVPFADTTPLSAARRFYRVVKE